MVDVEHNVRLSRREICWSNKGKRWTTSICRICVHFGKMLSAIRACFYHVVRHATQRVKVLEQWLLACAGELLLLVRIPGNYYSMTKAQED